MHVMEWRDGHRNSSLTSSRVHWSVGSNSGTSPEWCSMGLMDWLCGKLSTSCWISFNIDVSFSLRATLLCLPQTRLHSSQQCFQPSSVLCVFSHYPNVHIIVRHMWSRISRQGWVFPVDFWVVHTNQQFWIVHCSSCTHYPEIPFQRWDYDTIAKKQWGNISFKGVQIFHTISEIFALREWTLQGFKYFMAVCKNSTHLQTADSFLGTCPMTALPCVIATVYGSFVLLLYLTHGNSCPIAKLQMSLYMYKVTTNATLHLKTLYHQPMTTI